MNESEICIFGEVLFDHFPDGSRVLGGAPFNVAWHLQAFGQAPRFLSRVGDDAEGEQIREAMRTWGMDTAGLQTDPVHATGRVDVSILDGEPAYEIVHPCAYDLIEPVADACRGLLYHGSLCLRDEQSLRTLQALKSRHPGTVFVDVNLRPPWWHRRQVLELVSSASWVKLNTDELARLSADDDPGAIRPADFLDQHRLDGLLLTHGAQGAELFTADGARFGVQPSEGIRVVDTVGAGDAFASVMILGLVSHWPPSLTLQRAQEFASAIVARRGATVRAAEFYDQFITQWQLPA